MIQRNNNYYTQGHSRLGSKHISVQPPTFLLRHHLVLWSIAHSLAVLVLLTSALAELLLTESSLLILLDDGTASAAAGKGEIGQACALEVVLLADIGTLHEHGNPVETEAAGGGEQETLLLGLGMPSG